jgi:TolA-binding protein
MMRIRLLLVTAFLLASVAVFAQDPASSLPPLESPFARPPATGQSPITGLSPVTVRSVTPTEKSIDQLIDEVEQVRAQKGELERKEQELLKEIRKKLDKQAERVNRLGTSSPPPTTPPTTPSSVLPTPGNRDLIPAGYPTPR